MHRRLPAPVPAALRGHASVIAPLLVNIVHIPAGSGGPNETGSGFGQEAITVLALLKFSRSLFNFLEQLPFFAEDVCHLLDLDGIERFFEDYQLAGTPGISDFLERIIGVC